MIELFSDYPDQPANEYGFERRSSRVAAGAGILALDSVETVVDHLLDHPFVPPAERVQADFHPLGRLAAAEMSPEYLEIAHQDAMIELATAA